MSDWSPPTSPPRSPPIRQKGGQANMGDDTRSLVISPQSVECGSKQLLYFMFVQPTIKMTSSHDYKVIFQGDQKSTKVPATKLNMYTLYARFPQRLLPGTTSCTVVHNNRRIGSVDLKVAGPTEVLTNLLESAGDPLELMCTAMDVKSSDLNSLDKKLHGICKNNMPPGGFEDILRLDQITTGMNTISLFECPTALHFSAKYGLSNLCSVFLTWPGALQASRTVNKDRNWPSDMAARTGNVDLEEYIDEVVEQLFDSSEYHQYESADAVDKKGSTQAIPGQEGGYVKFVQSTVMFRQHDYDNVTDGAMQDKDQDTQMEAAQALPAQPPLKPKQPRLPGPMSMSYIDNKGGQLHIDDLAITLMFPPDSVPFGVITNVTLSVCWNEDYPPIAFDQMVMGPVIRCGPEGMTFQKQVQLSLPCKIPDLKAKSIQVWCNELANGNGTDKLWKKVYDGNQPTGSSVNLALVSNFLILSTPHFSRFSFLLRRRRVDRKILVFMTPINILRTDYVYVKVYAVREDKEKETRLEETRYGGHTCAMPAEYEVKYGKKNLQITLTEFEPLSGWAPSETEKNIPYRCLQRGGLTSKCVFTMKKRESQINSIRGSLSIHQEGNTYSIPDLKFDLIFVPPSILDSVKESSRPEVPQRKESLLSQALQIQPVVPDSRGSYTDYHVSKAKPAQLDNEIHYYMASKTKGLAIVVNIMTFPRRQRATRRSGSEIDLVNMVHLFREIGYEVEKYQDLTAVEITRNIKAFAARLNSREANYHSAVIVLMSHGSTGTIHGKYDEMVLLKDIQAEFNGNKCPKMRGKPKLFFVQAYRGTDQMLDTVLECDGNEENDTEEGSFSTNTNAGQYTRDPDHGQSLSNPHESADNYQIEDVPENADMHLAYATTDGYLSLRSETEGSWFVQALSEVFLARVHLDSLDELMNKVTSRVAALKGRMYDTTRRQHVVVKQSPERVSRMRKKRCIFFLVTHPE